MSDREEVITRLIVIIFIVQALIIITLALRGYVSGATQTAPALLTVATNPRNDGVWFFRVGDTLHYQEEVGGSTYLQEVALQCGAIRQVGIAVCGNRAKIVYTCNTGDVGYRDFALGAWYPCQQWYHEYVSVVGK